MRCENRDGPMIAATLRLALADLAGSHCWRRGLYADDATPKTEAATKTRPAGFNH